MVESSKAEELLRKLLAGATEWSVARRSSLMHDHDWRFRLLLDEVLNGWKELVGEPPNSIAVASIEDRLARIERDIAHLRLLRASPVETRVVRSDLPQVSSAKREWRDFGQGDWRWVPPLNASDVEGGMDE